MVGQEHRGAQMFPLGGGQPTPRGAELLCECLGLEAPGLDDVIEKGLFAASGAGRETGKAVSHLVDDVAQRGRVEMPGVPGPSDGLGYLASPELTDSRVGAQRREVCGLESTHNLVCG
ncbi:MAG: hypothetical protein VYE68_01840 [Acidobacteriota bacterium]|nr:hypothetical protein [Acidobacteriota bacterium]